MHTPHAKHRQQDARGRRARRVAVAITMLAALASLTGCDRGPDATRPTTAETSSATPAQPSAADAVPYATAPPADADEAIAHAIEALDRYLALEGEIYTHPHDTTGIHQIARGRALKQVTGSASKLDEYDGIGHGRMTFEPDLIHSYTEPSSNGLDLTIEFGTVTLIGCLDRTELGGTNANGTPFTQVDTPRYRANITVVYSPDSSRWLVSTRTATSAEIETC